MRIGDAHPRIDIKGNRQKKSRAYEPGIVDKKLRQNGAESRMYLLVGDRKRAEWP
jgi:hypothetical protein